MTAPQIEGYVGAVTISLTIALGATFLSKRAASLGKNAANIIRATLPFAAVAGAGGANVTLMRRTELVEGVDVYDHEGMSYMLYGVGIVHVGRLVCLESGANCGPKAIALPQALCEGNLWMRANRAL
jgi:hypothetical protein